jgi:AcrR family transcriptional regulator
MSLFREAMTTSERSAPDTRGHVRPSAPTPIDETRRTVIAAARQLLTSGGPEAVSARALAQAVGASTKVIYSQFGGMPAVIAEVREEVARDLSKRLRQGDDPALSRVDRLARMASAYRDFARTEPHLFDLLSGSDTRDWDPGALVMAQAIIAPPHASQGVTDATRTQARVFWAMIHGPVRLERTGALGATADEIFAAVVAQATRAAIAPPLRPGRP